jgi:hypothetical protein
LIAKYQTEYAYQVAEVYGARSEADVAFAWLERAYVQRDGGLKETKADRLLRSLQADPRSDAFPRKMSILTDRRLKPKAFLRRGLATIRGRSSTSEGDQETALLAISTDLTSTCCCVSET